MIIAGWKVNCWGEWGEEDEVGVKNDLTQNLSGRQSSVIKKGKIYDLETVFKGLMPVRGRALRFDILAYASPSGRKNT